MILRIYMKSGNVLRLPNITEYEVETKGDNIVGLKIERKDTWWGSGEKLLVSSINLSQIEAVTKE
jgi:hypothetical protein